MPSLRSWVDGQIITSNTKPKSATLKVDDQVVLERSVNRGSQRIKELMAGTIAALSEDGQKATVTIPRAGGRVLRTSMAIDKLKPASAVYGRVKVHPNPAFRQIAR